MIFVIVSAILISDQLTKFLIIRNLALNQSVPVLKGIFHLTLVHNRGAAFGIFKGQLFLFIFATLAAFVVIYFSLKESKNSRISRVSLSLILAGALGNLIDRLAYGYVVDFLDFRIWPVFNIADSAITVGAFLLGWSILFGKDKKEGKKDVS